MIEQRSPDWFAARVGKATASRMSDIIAKTKSGYSTSRANYCAQLVCERLTGVSADSGFVNAAMQWGIDHEAEAASLYAFDRDVEIEPGGFVDHPTIAMSGASPDGLIGDEGLVEIKCPLTATHIDTLLSARVPEKHLAQINWQLACTGRAWCDYLSYDPRLAPEMRIFVQRVRRTHAAVQLLEMEVTAFLREVDAKVSALRMRYAA